MSMNLKKDKREKTKQMKTRVSIHLQSKKIIVLLQKMMVFSHYSSKHWNKSL